jgi:hypothetical protein
MVWIYDTSVRAEYFLKRPNSITRLLRQNVILSTDVAQTANAKACDVTISSRKHKALLLHADWNIATNILANCEAYVLAVQVSCPALFISHFKPSGQYTYHQV